MLGGVVKDLFDLLQDLGSELGDHLEGLKVLSYLLGLGGAEEDGTESVVKMGGVSEHTRRIVR